MPFGFKETVPLTLPKNTIWWLSFRVKHIAVTKKALLFFLSITFEIMYSNAFFLFENFSKNLFDFTPGLFFRASTQKPESSAKQGILNTFWPYLDLILAFDANVSPVSLGSLISSNEFKSKTLILLSLKICFTSIIFFGYVKRIRYLSIFIPGHFFV